MKSDLPFEEVLLQPGQSPPGNVSHHYGSSVVISQVHQKSAAAPASPVIDEENLNRHEKTGLAAFRHRQSAQFQSAKAARPHEGLVWDAEGLLPPNPPKDLFPEFDAQAATLRMPTSQRLTGKVAVGVVIVSGPGPLAFSNDEVTKVHADVQNGLSWLGNAAGASKPIQFFYNTQHVTLTLPDNPNGTDMERYWLAPTMRQLNFANPLEYVESLRRKLVTDWTYCAFFVKYSQFWFAYAYSGGTYLCMQYSNGNWGPDNIDRVFAHETGHIFNAPDEYTKSGCNCKTTAGIYKVVNGNCQTCAPGGGVACIMRANSWTMCKYTPWHLGSLNPKSIHFQSVAFPNVVMRMDGQGAVNYSESGGGKVNCQWGVHSWEVFYLVPQESDDIFAIGSVHFPGVYLRMDGRNVTQFISSGGGTVNCQCDVGPWEKFCLAPQTDGTVAIESVQFPGVFLRLDGTGVTQTVDSGRGEVNCQFGVGPWEKFHLRQ